MTDEEFSELREFAADPDTEIDHGYHPAWTLRARGWLEPGKTCGWRITDLGLQAFREHQNEAAA